MFRKLAVALAIILPLAAQVTTSGPAGVTRVDLIVTDAQGNRIRNLDLSDFTISENGVVRTITGFDAYSPDAAPAPAVTNTMYVQLFEAADPTPARRIMLFHSDAAGEAAAKAFVETHRRPGDQISIASVPASAELSSRIAAAVVELGKHPEKKKAVIVYGDATDRAKSFAMRRGVSLYDNSTVANAAEDLASFYSITFRSDHAGGINIKTTRPYVVRPTALVAPLTSDEAVTDAVIAQHAAIEQPNDLGIRLTAAPAPATAAAAGGTRQVKLHVFIPVRNLTLATEGEKVKGGFDVYVSMGNGEGAFSPLTRRTHAIEWPAAALEDSKVREIDFVIDVTMDPGRSHISVGVVDQKSKKTGFERIEVKG
jgi:hypothetical protein